MSKKRILVVEDNFMNKVLVKEILTLNGYEVLEAGDGKSGVDMAINDKPDLVLMDINLPEMDGVAATKLIKKNEACKGIPVVALTAAAMRGDDKKIMDEGFDGYVQKPIEIKNLIDHIESFLGGKAAG